MPENEESVFDSLPDGFFFSLDRIWRFTCIYPPAALNSGFEPGELTGQVIWEKFPQLLGDLLEGQCRRVMESQAAAHFEWQGVITRRWYDVRVYPSPEGISVFGVDAGERRHIKQQLLDAQHALEKNAQRSAALAEISNLFAEIGTDYLGVLQSLVQKTTEVFGDACVLRLISEDGRWLNPVAFYNSNPAAYEVMQREFKLNTLRPEDDMAGEVFYSGVGKVFRVDQPSDWASRVAGLFLVYLVRNQITQALIVPLRVKGKVIGTLGLTRRSTEKPYSQEDLVFLQELADQSALLVINARLYEEVERSLHNEKTMRSQMVQSEKNAALARLVSSVVHEIANPLQTVANSLFLLNQRLPEDPSSQELFEMASSETRRISSLLQQLRETYRPSKDSQQVVFNLVEILANAYFLIQPQLKQSNVAWQADYPPAPIMITGNPDQIKQVFLNICLNAIDAIGDEGGQITVVVSVEDQQACISFQDTGPGIPQAILPMIFEPFFTTKEKGTGLGLAICYDIVKDHGGKIVAESQPGQGATFKVYLPLH